MTLQNFTNQTALITGGGTGIGAAVARRLGAAGAYCVLAGRRAEPLEATAEAIRAAGGQAEAAPCDVTDPAQVQALVARALRATGRVDVLVNSAGVFQMAPFEETSLALFDATLGANLRGVFICCQAVWPHMRQAGGGQIINVSSAAGVEAYAGNAAYGASKFGLNGLTAVLALEGQPHNIRVAAVCPAATNTPIWKGQAPKAVRARMMPVEPLADLIVWLLSAPREVRFDPIVVRNFDDPWEV